MSRKALNVSSVGRIALTTEKETNLSIVGVILLLEGTMTTQDTIDLFNKRVIPRFTRFASTVKNYKFTEIPNYDCSAHVSSKQQKIKFFTL